MAQYRECRHCGNREQGTSIYRCPYCGYYHCESCGEISWSSSTVRCPSCEQYHNSTTILGIIQNSQDCEDSGFSGRTQEADTFDQCEDDDGYDGERGGNGEREYREEMLELERTRLEHEKARLAWMLRPVPIRKPNAANASISLPAANEGIWMRLGNG